MTGNPWEDYDHVSDRQPAYCPYCGSDCAKDGQGLVFRNPEWYQHHCPNCGFRFKTEVDP
jgi:transcription elongation factor Elf1